MLHRYSIKYRHLYLFSYWSEYSSYCYLLLAISTVWIYTLNGLDTILSFDYFECNSLSLLFIWLYEFVAHCAVLNENELNYSVEKLLR